METPIADQTSFCQPLEKWDFDLKSLTPPTSFRFKQFSLSYFRLEA